MRIGRSVAVLGIISLAGCHDVTEPTPPSGIGRYDLVANSAREMTYDEQRLADGQQVPGFAGVAYDSTGNVHVWLNDRGSESAARAHFANLLGKGFGTPASRANRNPTMQFHAAKYDYAQLYQFEQMVGRSLGDIRTFVYHSINERANIVELGVEPGTDTTAVRVALRRRTLPDEAVALRFVRPMKFLSGTIQDYAPRKFGGLQISSSLGICTLGVSIVPSVYSIGDHFLTASHCSTRFGNNSGQSESDNTIFYQPNSQYLPLGTERQDGYWYDDAHGCDYGKSCRESDVTVVRYAPGTQIDWGKVAYLGNLGAGQLNIYTDHVLDFAPTDYSAPQGQGAVFTGSMTGQSAGIVAQPCATVAIRGTNSIIRCMTWVQATWGNPYPQVGDSGAPVWIYASQFWSLMAADNIVFEGILSGVITDGFTQWWTYSRKAQIEKEFSSFRVYY